jgi:hypothetical protein
LFLAYDEINEPMSLGAITVEVCYTGHFIMFKVILKLFAEAFLPFFFAEKPIPIILLLISDPIYMDRT